MDWEAVSLLLLAAHFAGRTAMTWLAHACGLFSLGFAAVTVWAAWRLFRRPEKEASALPPVTILKPLKGEDRELYENLASFCAQDYPVFQVLFCVDSPEDPALRAVERLRRAFPALDMEVVVSQARRGLNPKISNLANAYPLAKYGFLLISDSDIRVRPDYLRRSVGAFEDPKVGLSTSFYRAARASGLWGTLESLSMNAQYMPQAMAASAFGMQFAMGAAMLVRREAFEAAGGFSTLADHIADDFTLGQAILARGWRIEFGRMTVDSVTGSWGAADFLRHQVREFRTVRICQPGGYVGTILLNGFALLTLKMALFGADPASLRLFLLLALAKPGAAWAIHRLTGEKPPSPAALALVPVSDCLTLGFWLSGLRSGPVLWRGVAYSVEPSGRLVPARAAPGAL